MAITTGKGAGSSVVTNVATVNIPKAPMWGPYLAQWVMPIQPVPEGSLPTFKTGENIAIQVHPVTWTASGNVDTVRCIVPLMGGQTSANVDITSEAVGDETSAIPNAAFLDDLYLQLDPENTAKDYRFVIRDGLETPWRVGPYLDRRRYTGRFRDQFSTRVAENARVYLNRRSDIEIYELDIEVNTGVIDPTSHVSDGEGIYLGGIRLGEIPAGWSIVTSVPRPTMDLENGWLLKPLMGSERNFIPPSTTLAFRVAICRTSERATAQRILRREQWGYTSGDYSYYTRAAYGESQYRLMDPRNTFSYNSLSGRDGMISWAGEFLDQMEDILSEYDTSSGIFFDGSQPNADTGWIFPPWQPHGGNGGGRHKSFYSNYSNHPDEFAACDLLVEQQYHRMYIWLTDPTTGETLHASDFADVNGGVLPWSTWFGNDTRIRMIPPMTPVSTLGANSSIALLPNNRPWNQLETGNTHPYGDWSRWYESGGTYSPGFNPFPSSHASRMMGGTRTLIWSCDDDISRDLLEAYVSHYSFAVSPQPVAQPISILGFPPGSGGSGGQYADLQAMKVWNTNNPNEGGFFSRDVGEMTVLDAAYYRLASGDRRDVIKSKFQLLLDNFELEHYLNGSNMHQSDGSHIYGPETTGWTHNWSSYYYTTLLFHQEEACFGSLMACMAALGEGVDTARFDSTLGWIEEMYRTVHDGYDPSTALADPTRNVITAYRINPWGQNYGYGGAQSGNLGPGDPGYEEIPYYREGIYVEWNGNNYRCLLEHVPDITRDPSNATYWVLDNSVSDGDGLPEVILYPEWVNSVQQEFNRFEGSKLAVLLYRYSGDTYYLDRAKQCLWGQDVTSWATSGGDLTYDEAVDQFWGGAAVRMSQDGRGFSAFVNTLHLAHWLGAMTELNAVALGGSGVSINAQAQRVTATITTSTLLSAEITAQAQQATVVVGTMTGQPSLDGGIRARAQQATASLVASAKRVVQISGMAQPASASATAVAEISLTKADNFIVAVDYGYPGGDGAISVV